MPDLKAIFENFKKESQEIRSFSKFKTALELFDENTIRELLDQGISLEKYERYNGPAISSILRGFEQMVLDYSKNYSRKYIDYFYNEIYGCDLEDLDSSYQSFYLSLQVKLMELVTILHDRGASLNAVDVESEDLSSLVGAFTGKKVIERSYTPLNMIVRYSSVLKTDKFVEWILKQDGVIKDFEGLVEFIIQVDNNTGTLVLNHLLESGAPIKNAPAYIPNIDYNPLIYCLLHTDKTLKDKMNILMKYADADMVRKFNENYGSALEEKIGLSNNKIKL